ncbi:hypothetical protein Hanom_Chr11g01027841 [Helianthus anomalus]
MQMVKDLQEKIWDDKRNICAYLNDENKYSDEFKDVMPFLKHSRIHEAITVIRLPYESHIKEFWENIMIISEQRIREKFKFGDYDDDPILLHDKMVKGCFLYMCYKRDINSKTLSKGCLPKPYKYLLHFLINCLGHRKGGFDKALEHMMSAVAALCLNRKFHFSKNDI